MKKILLALVIVLVQENGNAQNPTQWGTNINVLGVWGNSVAFGGAIGGSYAFAREGVSDSYSGYLEAFIGPNISGKAQMLLGGGLEQNLKYSRNRPFGVARVIIPHLSLEGKYFMSQQTGYGNDFSLGGTVHPGAGILGLGVVYRQDYDDRSINFKLSFRFVGANTNTRITRSFCGGR
jgi:hypothetical protein